MSVCNTSFKQAIFLSSLFILYFFIYYPGLKGGFLLDDFGNLDKLGDYNGIHNLDTFLQYITGGIAGPTGRPISLLSFLLDADNWPADPYPFKRTNLILHGLNGLLVFAIIRSLSLVLGNKNHSAFVIALLSSGLWLLHPFQVSTVLYVVQRMAMLSAFFSLLGIWLYLHGRSLLNINRQAGYYYMTAGVAGCTLFAVFSKENGALLPLLILCIEWILHASGHPAPQLTQRWKTTFLYLPALAILLYLASQIDLQQFDTPLNGRDFSLKQRLLTESRIVLGYLYSFVIPKMSYPGVFNESLLLSDSLTDPGSTLASVIIILLLLYLAFLVRKRYPSVSLAIVFFFAGHLLESTTLSLELYFEHRNYLPSIFLFLPLAELFNRTTRRSIKTGLSIYILICLLLTYQRTQLWGNPQALTLFWSQQNSHSARAQRMAAMTLEQHQQPGQALALLTTAETRIPDSLGIKLHRVALLCQYQDVSNSKFAHIQQALQTLSYTSRLYDMLDAFVNIASSKQCSGLTPEKAVLLLDALAQNPSVMQNPAVTHQLYHLKGTAYLQAGKVDAAFREFTIALKQSRRAEHGLLQTGLLASFGAYKLALQHLKTTEKITQQYPDRHSYFARQQSKEILRLRKQIEQDCHNAHRCP